jgi:hypothetical protein
MRVVDIGPHFAERGAAGMVDASCTGALFLDRVRILENLEVLRDRRLACVYI